VGPGAGPAVVIALAQDREGSMRPFVTGLGLAALLGLLIAAGAVRADEKEEKIPLDKVPKAVLDALKAKYPDAELVSAEKEIEDGKTIYEVAIKNKGQKLEVSFSPEGKFIEAEKAIDVKDLPKAVTDALEAKYPKATIKRAEEVTKDDGVGYEVLITTADKKTFEIELDAKGKILEEESKDKKKEGDKKEGDKKEGDKKK
jgi:uncharacterized membrane protein YkoI